jgi:hypothetical protein
MILHTKVPKRVRNAHHDTIRSYIAEHAADHSYEELDEGIEIFAADPLSKQSVELGFVDRPNETLVHLELRAESLLGARPIPKSTRVPFAGGFETIHDGYPAAGCGHFFGEAHQTYANGPKAAVIGRTTSGSKSRRPLLKCSSGSGSGRHFILIAAAIDQSFLGNVQGHEYAFEQKVFDRSVPIDISHI